MNASEKSTSYQCGLLAGFEGRTFSERTAEITEQAHLDEWQSGWCDAHGIRVLIGAQAADRLRLELRRLP